MDCMIDGPKHLLIVPKTDFHFLRVDIDVNQMRRKIDEQNGDGILVFHQERLVCFIQRSGHDLAADQSAVDKKTLLVARVSRQLGSGNDTGQQQQLRF